MTSALGSSTARFYDRATSSFAKLQNRADQLSAQIAGQKRVQAPSDDPLAYRRLAGLTAAEADDKVYGGNLTMAAGVLAQADTTLGSISDQIQQASALAVRGNNATLTRADRVGIANELDQILATITGLMNGTDQRGVPLFGGADGGAAAAADANGAYVLATTVPSGVPVGAGQSVQTNDPATKVFGFRNRVGAPSDPLQVIAALSAALREPELGTAGDTGIADLSAAHDQVVGAQASFGARAARVELMQDQQLNRAADREEVRQALEGSTPADTAAAITELQKTMTVLQVTQQSFAKLSALSLFDYLR